MRPVSWRPARCGRSTSWASGPAGGAARRRSSRSCPRSHPPGGLEVPGGERGRGHDRRSAARGPGPRKRLLDSCAPRRGRARRPGAPRQRRQHRRRHGGRRLYRFGPSGGCRPAGVSGFPSRCPGGHRRSCSTPAPPSTARPSGSSQFATAWQRVSPAPPRPRRRAAGSACCRTSRSPGKGDDLRKKAHGLLEPCPAFVGNVEGRDLMSDRVDVVVTDGFTGNVGPQDARGAWSGPSRASSSVSSGPTRRARPVGWSHAASCCSGPPPTSNPDATGGALLLGSGACASSPHGSSSARAIVQRDRRCRRVRPGAGRGTDRRGGGGAG